MKNPELIAKVSLFATIALVIIMVIADVIIPNLAEPTDGLATVDSIPRQFRCEQRSGSPRCLGKSSSETPSQRHASNGNAQTR